MASHTKQTVYKDCYLNSVKSHTVTQQKVVYTDKQGKYVRYHDGGKRYIDAQNHYRSDIRSVPMMGGSDLIIKIGLATGE